MDSSDSMRLFHILDASPFFGGLSPDEKRQLADYLLRMYPRLVDMPEGISTEFSEADWFRHRQE
jgi:hypothetical protein